MTDRPCVVILTGGGLPGDEDSPPAPHVHDIDLALDRAAISPDDRVMIAKGMSGATLTPHYAQLLAVAAAAFAVGFRQAATLARVVAVYVVDDRAVAERLARHLTAEVDPAYVRQSASPLSELLASAEQHRAAR